MNPGSAKEKRLSKIPFRFDNRGALIDNNIKLVVHDIKNLDFELYNLSNDPTESNDISLIETDLFKKMKNEYVFWNKTVDNDVKKKKIVDPVQWRDSDKYFPFFDEWIMRKEYSRYIKREPYRSIFLTFKGQKIASESKKRHNIVYNFLLNLGLDKNTASEDAEGIEHHVSEKTLRKMDNFNSKK